MTADPHQAPGGSLLAGRGCWPRPHAGSASPAIVAAAWRAVCAAASWPRQGGKAGARLAGVPS
jgi:hypothetical protein